MFKVFIYLYIFLESVLCKTWFWWIAHRGEVRDHGPGGHVGGSQAQPRPGWFSFQELRCPAQWGPHIPTAPRGASPTEFRPQTSPKQHFASCPPPLSLKMPEQGWFLQLFAVVPTLPFPLCKSQNWCRIGSRDQRWFLLPHVLCSIGVDAACSVSCCGLQCWAGQGSKEVWPLLSTL